MHNDQLNPRTFWEGVSHTTWGRYISGAERTALILSDKLIKFNTKPEISALDVGCDGGRWSMLLKKRGWKIK